MQDNKLIGVCNNNLPVSVFSRWCAFVFLSRCQMHKLNMIKDRRYHLRKYKQCFIAKDVIDWAHRSHHTQTREEAVAAMLCLQQHGMIHHGNHHSILLHQSMKSLPTMDADCFNFNVRGIRRVLPWVGVMMAVYS